MRSLLFLCLLLAGCVPDRNGDGLVTVACLGDSNTHATWPNPPLVDPLPPNSRWCERLASVWGYRYQNQGWVGGAVIPYPAYTGQQADGRVQFEAVRATADVVIAGFLTNDAWFANPPAAVVAELQSWQQALGPVPLWILTAPMCPGNPFAVRVAELNVAVRAAFPGRVVDVVHPASDCLDTVHLNAIGQQRRANAVAAAVGF